MNGYLYQPGAPGASLDAFAEAFATSVDVQRRLEAWRHDRVLRLAVGVRAARDKTVKLTDYLDGAAAQTHRRDEVYREVRRWLGERSNPRE